MVPLRILVLNAGSSSLKASLHDLDDAGADGDEPTGLISELTTAGGEQSLDTVLNALQAGSGSRPIDAIGHRVVHGGSALRESVVVTPAVRATIERVAEYAPAHNAAALALMEAASRRFGDVVAQIAVFDTAFHRTLAPAAFTYAGPREWVEQGIRRFGFHGISHQYASQRTARLLDRAPTTLRIVSCHLGSGCSLAAVQAGRSVDTTMGFTPLDGVPMARRSGAIDPGIIFHLLRHGGHTADSLDHLLNHEAGLAGLSGTTGDMREVLAAVDLGSARARLALDVFVRRIAQGIAAMATSLGGLDAIAFTGGVGEHSPRVRDEICALLAFLGVSIDAGRNATAEGEADVSAEHASVRVVVVPSQENWMIARECVRVIGAARVAAGA